MKPSDSPITQAQLNQAEISAAAPNQANPSPSKAPTARGWRAGVIEMFRDLLMFRSREELLRGLLSAICFFCVLCSYYLIRPIREQFAASMGGSDALPRLYLIVFLTMLALTPVYGAIVARFRKVVFVPVIYITFILSFFALKWLAGSGLSKELVGTLVFVYVSIFNLFVVSVFWSCMADSFDQEQAKRLFGFIAAGGSVGAIVGPKWLLPYVVKNHGVDTAYLVSALLMLIALMCMLIIFALTQRMRQQLRAKTVEQNSAKSKALEESHETAIGGSAIAGAIAVFRDPFLRAMMLLMLCGDAIATILYANISDHARDSFVSKEQGVLFFANLDTYTNSTIFVLQLLVAAIAIKRLGATKVISYANMVVAVLLLGVAVTADVWLMLLAMVTSRGGTYGLVNPARESLFARVDREARFKAKNFIDTAIWRLGDVLMVSLVYVLKAWHASLTVFGLICASAAIVAAVISWRMEHYLQPQRPKDS